MSDMATESSPYREKFPLGSNVRIKDTAQLEEFNGGAKTHHPKLPERRPGVRFVQQVWAQVLCARRLAI